MSKGNKVKILRKGDLIAVLKMKFKHAEPSYYLSALIDFNAGFSKE